MVFYLLGRRSGILCLALVVLHTLLLHLCPLGFIDDNSGRTQANDPLKEGVLSLIAEWIQSGTLRISIISYSPIGNTFHRLALLATVTSFAFFTESRRSLAFLRLEHALREKEAVNAGLVQATEAKTNFLANMSHGSYACELTFLFELFLIVSLYHCRAAHADARHYSDGF